MSKIVFTNRLVENPGRVKLTPVAGQPNVYDVERQEGNIIQPGTPINAETLGSLVSRKGDTMEGDLDMKIHRLKFGGSSGQIFRVGNSNQLKFEGFDVIAENLYDGYYRSQPARVFSYRNKPVVTTYVVSGLDLRVSKTYMAISTNGENFSVGYNVNGGTSYVFYYATFAIFAVENSAMTIFGYGSTNSQPGSSKFYQHKYIKTTGMGAPRVSGSNVVVLEIGGGRVDP